MWSHDSWCQGSANIPTHMSFSYYTSFCPSQNTKVKTVIVTFLSHNSDKTKQTTKCKNTQSTQHTFSQLSLTSSRILLYLPQLFLSSSQALFSLALILCVVLHPQNQFKEVFFTLCCWCNGKSFNTWLFLQLRLKSAIYKHFSDLKNAHQFLQYFIERFFQYFWDGVVAEVEALL